METFDARLRAPALWLAVIVPPLIFWGTVQWFVVQAGDVAMPATRVGLLVGLAYAIPLAALGWMLCSVAAYTVGPGKLIRHRVVSDREFSLGEDAEIGARSDGRIEVHLPNGTLRLCVAEPQRCLAALRRAMPARRTCDSV